MEALCLENGDAVSFYSQTVSDGKVQITTQTYTETRCIGIGSVRIGAVSGHMEELFEDCDERLMT